MKLIKQWKDTKYNVENFLYENKDGLKVLHTLNPQTLDTYASFVVKAGSYFEKQLGVPNGTAHFLEHMICNPNNVFKSDNEIDKFEFGTSKRPEILSNAGTSLKYIMVYGLANSKREDDLLKRISLCITYPLDKLPKHIESERKVILAELQRDKKPEKNPELQFLKFALTDKVYTNEFSVIGETEENIKKISVENLQNYYTNTFTIENSIISIQSGSEISKKMIEHIDSISEVLKKNGSNQVKIMPEVIDNSKEIGYFANTEKNGIKTRLFFFRENTWKLHKDYTLEVLRILSSNLLHFVIFREMREKKGYIYASNNYSTFMWDLQVRGIDVTTDIKNLDKAIDLLFQILRIKAIDFLQTAHGRRWLENEVSRFIFPHTQEYDEAYAESQSINYLESYEPFDFEQAKIVAKNVTPEKLENYVKENISKMTYGVWIDSSVDLELVKKKIKKVKALKEYV